MQVNIDFVNMIQRCCSFTGKFGRFFACHCLFFTFQGAVGIPLPGVEVQIAAIASENDTEYRVSSFSSVHFKIDLHVDFKIYSFLHLFEVTFFCASVWHNLGVLGADISLMAHDSYQVKESNTPI